MHKRTSLCRAPTLLDVMDHVLDKGVIVEATTSAATEATSTSHIALLDVTVRVDVTTDAEDALKETIGTGHNNAEFTATGRRNPTTASAAEPTVLLLSGAGLVGAAFVRRWRNS